MTANLARADTQRRDDLFEANLAAFKEWAPSLHSRLAAISEPHSELIVGPDGALDMALMGQPFYGEDAVALAKRQIAQYFAHPTRQLMNEPNLECLGESSGSFVADLKSAMAAASLHYDAERCPIDSHFLMVFGVGLGIHVAPLLELSQAKVVELVEPNLECLYHSLFVTDWQAIFEEAAEQDRHIGFVVDDNPVSIGNKLRASLRRKSAPLMDGMYVFTHYPSSILEQANDCLRHGLHVALAGLGFFDDELWMTGNAAENLSRGDVQVLSDYHPPRSEPVFLVGSGPSVEKDLPFIRDRRDRALLVSIGTGLRVLLEQDIRPDFHIEIENREGTVDVLRDSTAGFDLGGVTLIGSLTVRPGVLPLFDRSILFFRDTVSSTQLFGELFRSLRPTGPTVANAGLAVTIRMGFREIYLFGVDLGSRSMDKFHAAGSIYGAGLLMERVKADRTLQGNFGGDVNGASVYNWSRAMIEVVLQSSRNLKVYNCSDGARIEGAIPKVARAIELPNVPIDRPAVRQSVDRYLNVYTRDRLRTGWNKAERLRELHAVFDYLQARLEEAGGEAGEDEAWYADLHDSVQQAFGDYRVILSYVSGTLLTIAGIAHWYERRLVDPDLRPNYRRLAAGVSLSSLQRIRERLVLLLEDVDREIAAA